MGSNSHFFRRHPSGAHYTIFLIYLTVVVTVVSFVRCGRGLNESSMVELIAKKGAPDCYAENIEFKQGKTGMDVAIIQRAQREKPQSNSYVIIYAESEELRKEFAIFFSENATQDSSWYSSRSIGGEHLLVYWINTDGSVQNWRMAHVDAISIRSTVGLR